MTKLVAYVIDDALEPLVKVLGHLVPFLDAHLLGLVLTANATYTFLLKKYKKLYSLTGVKLKVL